MSENHIQQGAALPILRTVGNRIVRADTAEPVVLRGVNLSGLEYAEPTDEGFLTAARITEADIRFLATELGCNVLRLPFNQDWALNGRKGHGAVDYLNALDRVTEWARRYGAYTLLDLQWLDADIERGGKRQFVPPLPNQDSFTLWRTLATRYCNCPSVLFDLLNEPHNRLPGDRLPLRRPSGKRFWFPWKWRVTARDWNEWALALATAIRERHPDSILFVSGVQWGYDLRGVSLPLPNIVYSTHIYPNKRPGWNQAFGDRSALVPVFAGEVGGEEHDLAWGEALLGYLEERDIGWTAWSWRDWPHLQHGGRLTAFGKLVASRLASEPGRVNDRGGEIRPNEAQAGSDSVG